MDLLAQHEAFLRAIYDAPDDDTPRLVYADFLEEHGDPDKAAYIRYECEMGRCEPPRRTEVEAERLALLERHDMGGIGVWPWYDRHTTRGFPLHSDRPIEVKGAELFDPGRLRATAVRWTPQWFGARALKLLPPAIRAEHVEALFALPFVSQVREWDFSGDVEEAAAGPETDDGGTFGLIDMIETPVITVAGVDALCEQRALRRVETLNLTHNNLDNDAARALVRCPYLVSLKKLDLFDGNRFRGKTWSQLVERFGEGVVG